MSKAAATDAHAVHTQEGKRETILVRGRRLLVVGKLGEGTYSVVFLVQDPESRRRYALKRIAVRRDEDLPRLVGEMERAQSLSRHPFICTCYGFEVSRVDGTNFAAMLMQHGGTPLVSILADRAARRDPFSQSDVLRLALHVCSALSYMHHQEPWPLAHRDVKAENIMEQHGVFRIVDFGSATNSAFQPRTASEYLLVQGEVATQTTMAYRAPEMCDVYRNHRIDQAVDVWAVGVLIYYAMHFALPFEETALSVLAGNVRFPPEPLYSDTLREAVRRCLVQNPAERWGIDALLAFLEQSFPDDAAAARAVMDAMQDDENPDLLKSSATRSLAAAGTMGVQPLASICATARANAAAHGEESGGGGGSDAAAEEQQPAWMREAEIVAQQRAAAAATGAAGQKAGGGGGGLFSKLKWSGGGAAAGTGSGGAQATAQPSPPPQAPAAAPASAIDSLFAPSAPRAAMQAPLFDPFASSSANRAQPPAVAPSRPQQVQQPQQQQQQQRPPDALGDIFGSAPPPPPTRAQPQFVAQPSKQPSDPFANLFDK